MEKMTNDEFFKSLSDADWDKAIDIETEIGEILSQGFTEEIGIKFVRTVMSVKAAMPEATVGGIFDTALSAGLTYLGDKDTIARIRRSQLKQLSNGGKRSKRTGSTLK